jgi:hypothetical protein
VSGEAPARFPVRAGAPAGQEGLGIQRLEPGPDVGEDLARQERISGGDPQDLLAVVATADHDVVHVEAGNQLQGQLGDEGAHDPHDVREAPAAARPEVGHGHVGGAQLGATREPGAGALPDVSIGISPVGELRAGGPPRAG